MSLSSALATALALFVGLALGIHYRAQHDKLAGWHFFETHSRYCEDFEEGNYWPADAAWWSSAYRRMVTDRRPTAGETYIEQYNCEPGAMSLP